MPLDPYALLNKYKVHNEVWDTVSLDWVVMTQPLVKTDTLNVDSDVTDRAGRLLGTETNSGSIKTAVEKIPSQGQALESASMPVVLPAAQITILTPPAAITGFATSAKQLADGHNVAITGTPTVNLTKVKGEDCQVSGGTEEKSIRVTIANNSTGLLSVDDNGSSLTVDGSVSVSSIPHDTLTSVDIVTVTGGASQVDDVKVTLDSEVVGISGLVSSEITSGNIGEIAQLSMTTNRELRVSSSIPARYLNFFGDFNLGETNNFGGLKGYLDIENNPHGV